MKSRYQLEREENISFYTILVGFVIYGTLSTAFIDNSPFAAIVSLILFFISSVTIFFYLEKFTHRFWLIIVGSIVAMIVVATLVLSLLQQLS